MVLDSSVLTFFSNTGSGSTRLLVEETHVAVEVTSKEGPVGRRGSLLYRRLLPLLSVDVLR